MQLGKGVNKISVWWKSKGTFNDYVDKKKWVGGAKMSIFSTFRNKICPIRGRGLVVKKGPNCVHVVIECSPINEFIRCQHKVCNNNLLFVFLF